MQSVHHSPKMGLNTGSGLFSAECISNLSPLSCLEHQKVALSARIMVTYVQKIKQIFEKDSTGVSFSLLLPTVLNIQPEEVFQRTQKFAHCFVTCSLDLMKLLSYGRFTATLSASAQHCIILKRGQGEKCPNLWANSSKYFMLWLCLPQEQCFIVLFYFQGKVLRRTTLWLLNLPIAIAIIRPKIKNGRSTGRKWMEFRVNSVIQNVSTFSGVLQMYRTPFP